MADLADRTRQPFHRWRTANARAMRALLEGRLEEAERRARGALEIGGLRQSEYVTYLFEHACWSPSAGCRAGWASSRRQSGSTGSGTRRLPAGATRWSRSSWPTSGRPGRRSSATPSDFTDLPRDGLWLLHLCSLAEACVLLGDERRAARLYELLSPYADRNAISMTTMPFGPVALRLGMVAAMLGRWEEAERHFSWPWSGAPARGTGDHGPCPVRALHGCWSRAARRPTWPAPPSCLPGRRASAESWTCPGSGTVSRRLPPRSIRAGMWPARSPPCRVPSSGARATTGRWPTRARRPTSGT